MFPPFRCHNGGHAPGWLSLDRNPKLAGGVAMSEESSHFESRARRMAYVPQTCNICGGAMQIAPFSGTAYCMCEHDQMPEAIHQRYALAMEEVAFHLQKAMTTLQRHHADFLAAIEELTRDYRVPHE